MKFQFFTQTIYTLQPHPNAHWHDHGLESPTFFDVLDKNIKQYLKNGFL